MDDMLETGERVDIREIADLVAQAEFPGEVGKKLLQKMRAAEDLLPEEHNPLFFSLWMGVNVIEIGDYCMISPEIWERKFGLGWRHNLCIACIERRLGRPLSLACGDFAGPATVEGYPPSEILVKRLRLRRRG